jgi:hypothetical protein
VMSEPVVVSLNHRQAVAGPIVVTSITIVAAAAAAAAAALCS